MEYRRNASTQSTLSNDPFWILAGVILALLLCLAGLPVIIVGVFAQRYVKHLFLWHDWRWSFLFWIVLFTPSAFLFYKLYTHGLEQMILKELTDYIQTAKQHQTDFARWNFGRLWSETWPVWIRTFVALPIVGLWQEVSTSSRSGQTAQLLRQEERRREHRMERAQQHARRRTRRPERLPDAVGGFMVIGVPIDDKKENE